MPADPPAKPAQEKAKDGKDASKDNKKGGKKKDEVEELSPEDLKLQQDLELLVQTVQTESGGVQMNAIESLRKEIRTSTSSMTSVPKPLKFLRPHYGALAAFEAGMPPHAEAKAHLSDVLSVLALTMGKEGARESLHYKLTGSKEPIGTWGHEYVRNLAGEVGTEYDERVSASKPVADLIAIVEEVVPFCMQHNAEHEAVDLLLEIEQPERIVEFIDDANYQRVCMYLIACSNYVPEPMDSKILKICSQIYSKAKQYPDALRVAVKLGDPALIDSVFRTDAGEGIVQKQLAYMLARQRQFHVIKPDSVEDEALKNALSNGTLSEHFQALARDLDIVEAKTPEDIYKTHLETRAVGAGVDSARGNLASTFVNAFVNAGFGSDKLMTEEGGSKWLYKNKEHGMMSAAASLGLVLQWDVESALSQIDKYLYSNEEWVKAGALLGVGLITSGVISDVDPALALLAEYIDNKNGAMRVGAILGLAMAYAGTNREDVRDLVLPVLEDSGASMEVMSIAGLALGLIFVGSSDGDITQAIMTCLMERTETDLSGPHARFLVLGLSLLYLGKQGQSEAALEGIKALQGPIAQYGALTLEGCAYAGTGNVLKVQKMLSICGDHLEEDKNAHQAAAVLAISLIAMGEDLGSEMCLRSFDHLLQYGEPVIRRSVPLAMALINVSNPTRIAVIDTLSKLSHDHDGDVAMNAIMGLGLVGSGTNNARIAGLLRSLASYYYKEPNHLFIVRLAQGLLHLGKGTLTLSPFHSDRLLMSHVCVGGLLTVLHACMDLKGTILSKSHYLLFALSCSMSPRMLMTLDEDLKELKVPVRVGLAVDVVGQAGKPKTITGFQTHTTPVLLGHGDRAELATDDYIPHTSILEGFVILKPNPNATGNAPSSPVPARKK